MRKASTQQSNPNLFRGNDITTDDLVERMAAIAERTLMYKQQTRVRFSECISMTEFSRYEDAIQRSEVDAVLRSTLVGQSVPRSTVNADHLMVVLNSQRELIGAGLLKNGWYSEYDSQKRFITEPQINLQAYGVKADIQDSNIDGNVLHAIASLCIERARKVAKNYYPEFGTYGAEPYKPTVQIDSARLIPTIHAQAANMCLNTLLHNLIEVLRAKPTVNTGFGEKLNLMQKLLADTKQRHGDHVFLCALAELNAFRAFNVSLGGDETSYQAAHKVARTTVRLLTAIREGVQQHSDQLYPGAFPKPLTTNMITNADQADITLQVQLQGNDVGAVFFKPKNVTDPQPEVSFDCLQGTGLVSHLAKLLLEHASKGKWWAAQMK